MSRRVSARKAVRMAAADEKRAVTAARTTDGFQNFALKLGIGTDNALTGSTYGFNPITRNRTLLEWIHRGSWLGGVAVDLVADDMTRAGVQFLTDLPPDEVERIELAEKGLGLWSAVRDSVALARLYGGSILVPLIDGQRPETPLRLTAIGRGQLKGFLALDRWMVDPSLDDLVDEFGPHLGLPKFYTITALAPALRGQKVHYSRVLRQVGIKLPYWQAVMENLWGVSVYERLYDRMVAFDSATMGAAQSVYKSHLRTMLIDGMREAVALGGAAEAGIVKFVQFVAKYQGIEGVTLLDTKDKFEIGGATNFAGISDTLVQFGQQLSGALQIPLVRLFGQSPAGLNASGESDLRTYYDGINSQQNRWLKEDLRKFYVCMGRSVGIDIPDTFDFEFVSLWQLTEDQKSQVANRDEQSVADAFERGIIDQPTALRELRKSSRVTGRFTSVTDEVIEEAEKAPASPEEMASLMAPSEKEAAGEESSPKGAPDDESSHEESSIP